MVEQKWIQAFFQGKLKIFFSNLFVNVLICEVFVISQYFPYKHFADFDNELAQIVLFCWISIDIASWGVF